MPRRSPKSQIVAFKVEEDLAEFLNKLPNKSAFIRKAIAAQLGMACPLCNGKGVVPRGVHDHYAAVLKEHNWRMSDAARTLGIQRANLYRKTRQLGIHRVKPPRVS